MPDYDDKVLCELCGSFDTYPIDLDAFKCVECEGITVVGESEQSDSSRLTSKEDIADYINAHYDPMEIAAEERYLEACEAL